ncbi:MAG: hypothetical protein M3Y20_01580, partial [Actinomycetota bacterium]|nr:hypothetical protein [Actinomycetota bacterium]
ADDGPRRARGMLGDTEPLSSASGTASWGTASWGTASSAPPLPPRLRALLGALDAELVGRQS